MLHERDEPDVLAHLLHAAPGVRPTTRIPQASSRHRFHPVLMSCMAGSLDCLGQFKARLYGTREAWRGLRQGQDRPETFNDPPQAEYSWAIGSSLQLRNRSRVETTTPTFGVQTTRGVAVAPDVFSFFGPMKKPGAEPRASSVDQASTAETPGRLELEVFDPHTTVFEPTPSEINRREEREVGDEGAFGALTTHLEGVLAGFGDQTDRIAAGLAEADRLAAVVSGVEIRIATLLEREQSLTQTAAKIAAGLTEADRLAAVVSGVETRIATLEEREHCLTHAADRIAPGLDKADRLATVVSGVEARIATLEERKQSLTHAADRIPPGLVEADRLATVVSGVETRLATLLEREHSLTQAAERIGPGLAEADRLAELVSAVEIRIATLLERQQSLAQAADRIAPGLADADRLAAVVSRVKTPIAALLAREKSITKAAEPIVGQALHDRADEPAAPFPLVSVDAGGSNGDGSRLGEPKRTIGRLAVATGVIGLLALVVVGSGLVARRARPPVQAAGAQHKSEAHIATAASSPVLPSPAVDVPIPPAPAPLATAAPTTPRVIPAATKSASRKATSSKAATQDRARRPQPAGGDPSASPVFAGALAVQSNPAGGTVFLDRQRVGKTPLQLTGVTAGAHVIWIESPGHARWTTAVQVNTNKLVKVIATLEPQR